MNNYKKQFLSITKSIVTAILISASIFFAVSCNEKRPVKKDRTKQVRSDTPNLPTKLRKLDDMTMKYINGKSIILVLGYGFNDKETVEKIRQGLNSSFGVETEEKNALVSLFVFPDDFGKNERISLLGDMIENKNIMGMILFGAPDRTHKTISEMMDKSESRKLLYPLYSFFPQDDILGSQYISEFVVDYAGNADVGTNQPSTSDIENEKTHSIPNFDTASVITNAIQVMLSNSVAANKDDLIGTVQKIVGQNHKVSKYIDPETKIAAANHFTFE